MKFVSRTTEETITSREHLLRLVEVAFSNREMFYVGGSRKYCLQLGMYADEAAWLELHRGKKWSAWASPRISLDQIADVFIEYYQQGDLSDDRLNQEPEWLEMEGFHPAVYILIGIVMIGIAIYANFK